MNEQAIKYDLTTPYSPVALYFHEADLVEYVREDACCVFKRIDETLTLAMEMDTRLPIGFRIKGFKNVYLKTLPAGQEGSEQFIEIVSVLEKITCSAGNKIFDHPDMRRAYKVASDIAKVDDVKLKVEDLDDAA